ncbi:hypothetical protein [Kribbella turkmenica]|uniref:hypothetical protein n=1 Tax=Kribbella turkmenica TaxID=2530375 RepID=UPI001F3B49EB|nr:hypothetical protein [Kribbella turkmenica]
MPRGHDRSACDDEDRREDKEPTGEANSPKFPGKHPFPQVDGLGLGLGDAGGDRVEGPGGAYAKQQATRPQTIGYSLVDSPVGLLAWILDKFAEWSDTEDSPFETISRDRVLDDVTLYWLTRTGASSARIYYESHNSLDPELRVDVPSAISPTPTSRSGRRS